RLKEAERTLKRSFIHSGNLDADAKQRMLVKNSAAILAHELPNQEELAAWRQEHIARMGGLDGALDGHTARMRELLMESRSDLMPGRLVVETGAKKVRDDFEAYASVRGANVDQIFGALDAELRRSTSSGRTIPVDRADALRAQLRKATTEALADNARGGFGTG